MKNSYILIITSDYENSRNICEKIMNTSFKTKGELFTMLEKELKTNKSNLHGVWLRSIFDFVSGINNQELDNLTDSFITYIQIENK